MEYFIFDYNNHLHLIESFLESAAKAHHHPVVKTEAWFFWKFRDNPYGETLLACAEENGRIVGCVAYGLQPFWLKGEKIKGVISFETFVHPNYQGKGLFNKLIQLAEETVISKDVDLMLNFPNSNSLRGFKKNNWKQLESPEYWIKGANLFTIPLFFKDLRLGFSPNKTNLELLNSPKEFKEESGHFFKSVISKEYIDWRFFTFPISEYAVIEDVNYYSIVRIGTRGKIREAQVLFLNRKNNYSLNLKQFVQHCKQKTNYDIISFSISKSNELREELKRALFMKVPNKTNICYKILNTKVLTDRDLESVSLSAINYHTY